MCRWEILSILTPELKFTNKVHKELTSERRGNKRIEPRLNVNVWVSVSFKNLGLISCLLQIWQFEKLGPFSFPAPAVWRYVVIYV